MPKRVSPIVINETDVMLLRGIDDGTVVCGQDIVKRARPLLLMSDGKQLKEVAAEVGMRENTITDIRRRFLEAGIDCLYDKPKSGRPLSYDPDQLESSIDLRIQQCVAQNVPVPSAKELAAELKAPQNVIRDILQKKDIVAERGPHYWRFTMSDGTVPKLADMCGLYLSLTEQVLVVKAWTIEKNMVIDLDLITDTSAVVETRTKAIASKIEALIDVSGKVDVADALAVFAESGKTVRLGKKDSAISFVKGILPSGIKTSNIEYHIFTYGVSLVENNRSLLPDTYLHDFKTQEQWMSQFEIIATNMYSGIQGKEKAAKVRDSIYRYLRTAKPNTEPFEWMKVTKNEENDQKPMAPTEPKAQDDFSQSAPGTVRFTAQFVDDEHNVITVRVHTKIPITQAEFETGNRREYLNSLDKVEQAVISASREASRALSETYLHEIAKKKPVMGSV